MSDRAGDFGGKLRAARVRKGLSLREIANATKISVSVLEALEHNDLSRLPGGIFSRAFVRSYAVEVGLDPEEAIQDFIAQFPVESVTAGHQASVPIEDVEALESDRRVARTVLRIVGVSIPLAAALLYYGTSGLPSRSPGTEAVAPAAADSPAPSPQPPELSQPVDLARVQQPDTPAPATSSTASPSTATLAAATPSAATPPVARPPAASAAPASTAGTEAAPAAVAAQHTAASGLTVGLTARRPVWVFATLDGQKAIERLLRAGEQQTLDVHRELVLTAGDAAAISLTLNGAPARVLGKAGEVVTTRVGPSNYKEYLQTR